MKNFWGQGVPTLLFSACVKTVANALCARRTINSIIVLAILAVFSAVAAKAQDSFSAAEPLPTVPSPYYGSVTNDNTGVMADPGAPSIAGYGANAPLWYVWQAPQSGVVEMDTIGSTEDPMLTFGFNVPLDTVMAVYTGNSLSSLTQVTANDDLYPVPQENEIDPENVFDVTPGTNSIPILTGAFGRDDIFEYYSGPSGLRFNVVGGQTYYIAVDSKANQFSYIYGNLSYSLGIGLGFADTGPITLTWAYKPSGVFRFATENFDLTGNFNSTNSLVPPPLLITSQTETSFQALEVADHGFTYDVDQFNIQNHSYYPYNVAGVPVTITRVGGSSGRVWLTYSTVDGNTNLIQNGDQPAKAGVDYTAETNQTLIFDDGEMSKTIYVPILDNSVARGGKPHVNRDFSIAITGVQLDPYEDGTGDSASVSPPRVDSDFGQIEVRILDVDIDPKGPAQYTVITTNMVMGSTNVTYSTNTLWSLVPTNAVLNFAKANYRFPRDVTNYWNSAGGGTLVTIWVTRRGTNQSSVTAYCSVDNGFLANGDPGSDHVFPLEPGSDYANPSPPGMGGLAATNSDFSFEPPNGTYAQIPVNFQAASSGHGWDPQPVQFLVYDNGNATLDKDFIVDLYEVDQNGTLIQPGMVAQTKVTILADRAPVTGQTPADNRLPAGSVDENYNVDFGLLMAPFINTQPQNDPNPGADAEVDGLVVLTNNETLAVGSFDSYDENPMYGICLINANGQLDTSFNPGSGANVFNTGLSVNAVALTPDNQHAVIGGSFTSYNGTSIGTSQGEFQSGGVCRINLDGSLDSSFQPNGGPNGAVYALAVQPNGQVLIGGDFTQYAGQSANYLARLNADGSLDTSFNPELTGPVYSLAVQQAANITTNVVSTIARAQENDVSVNVSPNDQGNVIVNYMFPTTNEMQVFYAGNLIYDTGPTATGPNTPAQFNVAYGPGSTPIQLVVNPGGALASGTNYSYGAVVTSAASTPEVAVGGNFTVSVNGQSYNNIAVIDTNGAIDTSFNPTLGADAPIRAVAWQSDGHILIGGDFQNFNSIPVNRFARVNPDGSLDTGDFFVGAGADDTVYSINNVNPYAFNTYVNNAGGTNVAVGLSPAIYIGGQFSTYNGTRRLGFARLYTDGTVDTTFMDSTYNQFAGLPKIYSYDAPAVKASGVQSDGNVMIAGDFNEVGGGEAEISPRNQIDQQEGIAQSFTNKWLWLSVGGTDVEPNARDGVRNRSNIARLIGGGTPGPGNLELILDNSSGDSANRNQVTEPVSLIRTNGYLGPESANFSIIPGTAQSGSDLTYQSPPPIDYLAWTYAGPTRMHSDGLAGYSGAENDAFDQFFAGGIILGSEVNITVLPDYNVSGNLTATYQLANPANEDQLYLGGEDIPVGTALGLSSTPVTLIDNAKDAGTFSWASSTFIATNSSPTIAIVRTGGDNGTPSMDYETNSPYPNGGTALPGTGASADYLPIPNNSQVTFSGGQLVYPISLSVYSHGVVYTNFTEKTINLHMFNLRSATPGAAFGLTNTTVRLINPNFPGYLTLSATNYSGQEAPPYGQISFTVNRVAGSQGSLTVQYATADGSAMNGVDYVGSTNTLQWNNGDVSSRTITVPLINTGQVGTNKLFSVNLSNPRMNDSSDPSLFYSGSPGSITSATMTISNNNSYGSVQFSSTNYLVNEDGGYATITVTRSGGDAGPAYVNYATADGTAVAGANYSAASGTLTFAPNELSAYFEVAITNNGQYSATNLYFNVNLSNPVNLALGAWTNAQVTILNDQAFNQPPGSTNGGFNTQINGAVLALAYQTNGQIMAAGSFTDVKGLGETNVVRLNPDGSVDNSFTTIAGGTVQALVSQTDDRILIAGQFTNVSGYYLNYIGRLMTDGSVDNSFDIGAGANEPVYSLAETFIGGAREIYAGGAFSMINSVNSQGIARLNDNGSVDQSFNVGSGVDGTVYAIAAYPTNSVYAGDVIIGGSFIHYNGTAVNGIVRLTSSGSIDTGFNPGLAATNGIVKAITIQSDGKVLVGGDFTGFNGIGITNIVRLNGDGSVDTGFAANIAPGANDEVEQIVLQPDTRILVVGQFTLFGGLGRNGVTRLLSTGVTDPTINFGTGASGVVDAALVDPNLGLITLGGAFTTFNGVTADNIVQLYGLSQTGSGAFEFSSQNYQVTANGVVAPITIVRVGGTSGPNSDGSGNVYVNFSTLTNSGTAVPNVDYIPVSTNVAFPPGAVTETINVHVLSDYAATNNLTVGLLLTNATPPTIVTNQPTALLTILNANNALNFLAASTNIFESVPGGIANIAVVRQGSTNAACAVDFYTTTNGSGTAGVDFYPTNETLTFNPGVSLQTAQVLIISNSTPYKTVGMVLTNPVDTVLDAPTNEQLAILNNSTSPGQLCFSTTNYIVNESAGTVTLTVIRTNGYSGTVSCPFATVSGTAQAPQNYTTTTGKAQFDLNTTYSFTVPISQDTPPEGPLTFSVVLTNNTSAASLIQPTNATVTIVDDISSGVSFVNATNYYEETNGTVSVLVQRLGSTNGTFTVPFATTGGTAQVGVNYQANSSSLTFTPGETLQSIKMTLFNNQDVSNVTFGISLFPPTPNSVELLSPSNTLVVITPADAGIALGSPTNSVYKNAGSITIPVICLDPSNEPPILNSNSIPLSVDFATANGTGVAGVDYVATNGVLTFTNGVATNLITVQILNNSLVSGLRTFSVNIFSNSPVPPAKLIAPTNDVITIIDSNTGLSFSSANYSIDGGGLATITVIRQDNTNGAVSVAFATTPGGSAVPGADYIPTNGTLSFAPGQTSSSFTVTVIGSENVEPDKTILLALSSPNPTNAVLTAPTAATLTIYNQNGGYVAPAGVSLPVPSTLVGGILQSNQSATLNFGFRDAGGLNVSGLTATMLSSANITSVSPANQNYGPLTVNGHAVFEPFTFTPIGTNGQTISANFQLQVASTGKPTILETNSFALTVGSWTTTWSNTNAIAIPGETVPGVPMLASPYPSIITVTNVGGVLVGVTTTITNFSDSSPPAVEVMLVSPSLSDTLLMAGVGSTQTNATSVTLTFTNGAANSLPYSSYPAPAVALTNGVYIPTQNGGITIFP